MESINREDNEWIEKMYLLIDQLNKRKSSTWIVGEQVGWSLVSEYKIGNTYIERIGEIQKKITQISKENWLALNGRAIKIDDNIDTCVNLEITLFNQNSTKYWKYRKVCAAFNITLNLIEPLGLN